MTNLRKLQILGVAGIGITYILFVLAARDILPAFQIFRWRSNAWYGWSVAIAVGIIELITIFVYDSNITRFVRNMYGRPADMVFLFILLPVTWALAGELAAGFFLLGWLNSHMHEKE